MDSISVFDIIKIGIGPSSSHTMGPWEASLLFIKKLKHEHYLSSVAAIKISLYGSLAKTGKGHGTDYAILLGLSGYDYKSTPNEELKKIYHEIESSKKFKLAGEKVMNTETIFDFQYDTSLDEHPNGMTFSVILSNYEEISETYFSIGGGFIQMRGEDFQLDQRTPSKFPCHNGKSIIHYTESMNISVSDLIYINEETWETKEQIQKKAITLWDAMKDAIWNGLHQTGHLPGGLNVRRRANELYQNLTKGQSFDTLNSLITHLQSSSHEFTTVNNWVSAFALAVNEENASFGRVVTAPTNGAAGVIPSVLMYAVCFCKGIDDDKIIRFILTAGEIGTLYKKSATISAAMGGCQAEIGVSSSMAAAALTEVLGGSSRQVLTAAEIAMEHHLGLTCDPVGGLVQIPCIERNTMGAIKAITAANLSIQYNPLDTIVTLDKVIATMWDTARDMSSKYKETSEGGLATNIPVNIPEC